MTENEVVAWLSQIPKEKVSKLAQEAAEIRQRNNCKLGLVFCCPVQYLEGATHKYWVATHRKGSVLYGTSYSLYLEGGINIRKNSRIIKEAFEVDIIALHSRFEDHFSYMKVCLNTLRETIYEQPMEQRSVDKRVRYQKTN